MEIDVSEKQISESKILTILVAGSILLAVAIFWLVIIITLKENS
jgi:hypothetical protein